MRGETKKQTNKNRRKGFYSPTSPWPEVHKIVPSRFFITRWIPVRAVMLFLSTNDSHPPVASPPIHFLSPPLPVIVFCLACPIIFPRLGQKVAQIKNYPCRFTTCWRTLARHAEKRRGVQYPRWQEIFIWFSSPEQQFIPNRASFSPWVEGCALVSVLYDGRGVYGYTGIWRVCPKNVHVETTACGPKALATLRAAL